MSFKEVIMHTIVCDNCGQEGVAESDFAGWNDEDWALDEAFEAGWIEDEGNHYCSDCYEYDDNDELILKELK